MRGVRVMPIEELEQFLKANQIDIVVLTIPKTSAVDIVNILVENGIRAIWNFAHIDLELPSNIVVQNVHLSDSLMQLTYSMTQQDREKGK